VRNHQSRTRRAIGAAVAGATAISVAPLLGIGMAQADDETLPAVLDPTAEGAFCGDAPDDNPFSDVSAQDPALGEILCQAAEEVGVARGFADGTYGPNLDITRRQIALFIVRLVDLANILEAEEDGLNDLPPYRGANRFLDSQDEEDEVVEAINRLAEAGIVQGTSPVQYAPGELVTRRQMAQFVFRAYEFLTGEPLPEGGHYFSDTDEEEEESEAAIAATAGAGIFQGNQDGTFGPGDNLRRRQMALVNTRLLQLLFEEALITEPAWGEGSPFPEDGDDENGDEEEDEQPGPPEVPLPPL
jgi:hypothetical protein